MMPCSAFQKEKLAEWMSLLKEMYKNNAPANAWLLETMATGSTFSPACFPSSALLFRMCMNYRPWLVPFVSSRMLLLLSCVYASRVSLTEWNFELLLCCADLEMRTGITALISHALQLLMPLEQASLALPLPAKVRASYLPWRCSLGCGLFGTEVSPRGLCLL